MCDTKTKDNVFVRVVVAVQYKVNRRILLLLILSIHTLTITKEDFIFLHQQLPFDNRSWTPRFLLPIIN